MEYVTHKFDNTAEGIRQKDAYTQQLAAQGYRIVSEQVEKGHIKGDEQCCGALICLPLIFLAGRTPGTILVTYGRETLYCTSCSAAVVAGLRLCPTCKADLSKATVNDPDSARLMAKGRQEAAQRNADITKQVAKLDRILIDSLALDHQFDWNLFRVKFSVLPPQPAPLYEEPRKPAILRLSSTIPIIEKLIPAVREKGSGWEKASEQNRRRSEVASAQYSRDVSEWRRMRDSAEQEQTAQIEAKKRLYLAKDAGALHQYWAKVLERSRYPDNFPRSCSFGYAPDEQRLIVDFTLPPLASLPQVGEVKYNQSRDTLEDIPISELRRNDTYCGLAIKIALRTIYELFQSDGAEALTSVAFNGRIRSMDVSTGHTTNVFVISIEASKAEFAAINLAQVDPKACFTRLKGVLSDNLVKRTPIAPIRFKT